VQKHAFKAGDKVIVVDDLLATGGTLGASKKILSNFEGLDVVANVLIFEIAFLNGRSKLDVPTHCLIAV
jgi:adenine phosphoribosyltransferase